MVVTTRAQRWVRRIGLLVLFGLVIGAGLAGGSPDGHALAQAGCTFRLGFASLRDAAGASVVGDCLEDEHFNVANGNAEQQTTRGMLVWRKVDNFTAFTDGYQSWVNGPDGLQKRLNTERFAWERDPIQPASSAVIVSAAPEALALPAVPEVASPDTSPEPPALAGPPDPAMASAANSAPASASAATATPGPTNTPNQATPARTPKPATPTRTPTPRTSSPENTAASGSNSAATTVAPQNAPNAPSSGSTSSSSNTSSGSGSSGSSSAPPGLPPLPPGFTASGTSTGGASAPPTPPLPQLPSH